MKKNIEKRIYEYLGVNIFRKYFLFTYEKLMKLFHIPIGYRLEEKNIDGIKKYKKFLKSFALGHSMLLIMIIISIFYIKMKCYQIILNVGLNLYCIMVQRYNQIRINEILEKYQELEIRKKIKEKNNIRNQNCSNLQKANIISKKEQIVFQQNEIFNSENNMESEQKIVGSKIVRKRSLNNFCKKK